MRVLHIALAADWTAAVEAGEYGVSTRGRSLWEEGFIHCSTSRQVAGTLAAFYGDLDPAGLRLLVIDVPALEAGGTGLRWDDVPGSGEPFPHAYGPIPIEVVVAVLPIAGPADLSGWDVAAGAPRPA